MQAWRKVAFLRGMETSVYLPEGETSIDGEKKGMPIYADKKWFQTEASLNHQLLGQYAKGNISYPSVILDPDLNKFLLEI